MASADHELAKDHRGRFTGNLGIVSSPAEDQGVRDALRGAFACSKDIPGDFDRLLAKLR